MHEPPLPPNNNQPQTPKLKLDPAIWECLTDPFEPPHLYSHIAPFIDSYQYDIADCDDRIGYDLNPETGEPLPFVVSLCIMQGLGPFLLHCTPFPEGDLRLLIDDRVVKVGIIGCLPLLYGPYGKYPTNASVQTLRRYQLQICEEERALLRASPTSSIQFRITWQDLPNATMRGELSQDSVQALCLAYKTVG